MDGVQLYNLHATAAGAVESARVSANAYSLRLMIEHLHFVHGMGPRKISHEVRLPQNKVVALLRRAKIDREAYESRRKINPVIA